MQVRRCVSLVLLSVLLALVPFASPQAANAVSAYDGILGTTETMPVACRGGAVTDFTLDWFERMKEATPNDPALLKLQEKFDNDDDSGWGVKAERVWNGSPQNSYDWLTLYVMNQEAKYTLGSYSGPQSNWSVYTGLVLLDVEYFYTYNFATFYQNGADTCGGAGNYSGGGVRYENNAVTSQGAGRIIEDGGDGRLFVQDSSDENYLFFNASFIPPLDYAGEVLPRSWAPVTIPYGGTVDCGGEDPLLMSVYQAGNNGAAALAYESPGRASWSYNLTSAPYSVTVDCGGTLAGTFGAVLPSVGVDWVCDIYGTEPYYCVLG